MIAEVHGELVLFDPESGRYYGLDPVGAHVWKQLQYPKTLSELIDTVHSGYEVERRTLEQDLMTLFTELEEARLIQVVSAPR